MSEKLQKILARAGMGSRREIETWISQGRVSVDGKVAKLGDRAEPEATLRVDGKVIHIPEADAVICRVIAYNKPEGEVCTAKDPEGRPTVFERLPKTRNGRWIAVGRLDINTTGLLLFTNDGELANRLMHPSYELGREYAVRVFGEVEEAMLKRMQEGVMLDDGLAKFDEIRAGGGEGINKWFHVALHEGRNREVRRLWESQEVQVSRLIRTRYGDMELPKGLPLGAWSELELTAVNQLREAVELKPETRTLTEERNKQKKRIDPNKLRRTSTRSRARQAQRTQKTMRRR